MVQTFFGFFVSGGGAESCDEAGGAGAVLSGDCAAAEKAAKRIKIIANESERGIKPPVSQVRGRYALKPILEGKVSRIGGVRAWLAHLAMLKFLANGGKGFAGRADVAVV